MKGIKQQILIVIGMMVMVSSSVSAVTLDPASLTGQTVGATITIDILASPSAPASGVELRLQISGGTITGYTPAGGSMLTLPGCASIQTSTDICADIAPSSGDINTGDSLGTMTIQIGSGGTATVSKITGNQYTIGGPGGSTEVDTGLAGTYTTLSTLPDTAIFDDQKDRFILFGIILVTIGILIYKTKSEIVRKTLLKYPEIFGYKVVSAIEN